MNGEEKIIDIKDMLYRVCRQWRNICVIGLLFLICTLLIKSPSLIKYMKNRGIISFIEMIFKYGGIGFVIGIAFAFFICLFFYMSSSKLYLITDLNEAFNINLIGNIPQDSIDKKNPIDHLIKKIFGVKITSEMKEPLTERIAEEILLLVATRNSEESVTPVIALVSSLTVDVSASFEMQIAKKIKKDIRLVNAGNILEDARSVRMVNRADFIILVEKQGTSSVKEIQEICRKLSLWSKDILGVVLLDVV